MHPVQNLLGRAKLCLINGEPFPIDLLIEASQYGLSVSDIESRFPELKPKQGDLNGPTIPKVYD